MKTTTKIEIHEFSTMPALAMEGWDPNACSGSDYDTPRARALYEALGVDQRDEEYALARHTDGRWGLFGLQVTGHKFAAEAAEQNVGYIGSRAAANGDPIALLVTKNEQGIWELPADESEGRRRACSVDASTVHATRSEAITDARRRWRR